MAKKNNRGTGGYKKEKSLFARIFVIIMAMALVAGFIILPLASKAAAEGKEENVTVRSFETGKLAEALLEAADGTDYNYIKNAAVLSGTLNAADYSALQAIPNLEILELAGAETENGIIPENALPSRNQLTLVTLPKNTVEIGKNAFSGNRKLLKVKMPSTVTRIDDYAFAYCEAMTDIPVSEAVTYIGESAFQDCKAITEFVIPAGITEIYPNTFSKCGFEKISIGPNVEKIGMSVFADCNNLKDIYVYGEEAPVLDSDVFRNVSASVHCYDGSEESYKGWAQNNINIVPDLAGEYELKAVVPEENNEVYEAVPEETEAVQTQSQEQIMGTANCVVYETGAATDADTSGPSAQGGGLSVGVVIVIVVMAMIIAVLATVLVMMKKGGKNSAV